jgi:hypothetical protein
MHLNEAPCLMFEKWLEAYKFKRSLFVVQVPWSIKSDKWKKKYKNWEYNEPYYVERCKNYRLSPSKNELERHFVWTA